MGLDDKEWRSLEIVIVSAIFGLCVMGFFISQSGIREVRAEASTALKDATSTQSKQIDVILSDFKDYQRQNTNDHKEIMAILMSIRNNQ